MKARGVMLAVVWFVLVCLLAAPGLARGNKGRIIWKSGTLVPKGTGYAVQIKTILDPGLAKATNGDLYLKTYYGGVMGDDEDFIRKMRIGQLQACGLSAQGTLMMAPEMGVVCLPFLFEGWDEVDFIKEKMYGDFDELLAQKGMKLLLWLDQGFDQIYSTQLPLTKISQFKRARFLTWYGELEEKTLQALGARPVPVNVPEFNASIRQGVTDAYLGPAIWCVATQLYNVVRYINNTNLRYSPAIFLVTNKVWNELPEEHQKGIMADRGDWQREFCLGSRKDNQKCLEAMFQYGVIEIKPSNVLLLDMKERTRPVWDEMEGKLYSKELLERVNGLLQQYRASNPG